MVHRNVVDHVGIKRRDYHEVAAAHVLDVLVTSQRNSAGATDERPFSRTDEMNHKLSLFTRRNQGFGEPHGLAQKIDDTDGYDRRAINECKHVDVHRSPHYGLNVSLGCLMCLS